MSLYAKNTAVSPERTRAEIESTLARYGADGFGYMTAGGKAMVTFSMKGRAFRFDVALPSHGEFSKTETGRARYESAQDALWAQAVRQRWRALALWIKGTLEAIDSGIVGLDEAFLGQMMLPNGRRVADWAAPQIEQAITDGKMPRLLIASGKEPA